MYHDDIGIVCRYVPSSDAEVIVAFIPRMTKAIPGTRKRKRVSRPEPRRWSASQVEAIWGKSKVRRISDNEYEFGGGRIQVGSRYEASLTSKSRRRQCLTGHQQIHCGDVDRQFAIFQFDDPPGRTTIDQSQTTGSSCPWRATGLGWVPCGHY